MLLLVVSIKKVRSSNHKYNLLFQDLSVFEIIGGSSVDQMATTSCSSRKPEIKDLELIDVVFSWSVDDVLNKNLYSDKVSCFIFIYSLSVDQNVP